MEEAHERSHYRYAEINRHSLRDGFNGFLRALPGDRAFLPPSQATMRSIIANLAPASGCQNHTTSPSASRAFVFCAARVHRIPHPTSVTIAKRPSCGTGWATDAGDLRQRPSKLFFGTGLDDPNQLEMVQQIGFYAHVVFMALPACRRDAARKNDPLICPERQSPSRIRHRERQRSDPESKKRNWIASSHSLLAMTAKQP